MPLSYFEAASQVWYFYDAEGRPAVGGKMYTYDSLTRLPRATYSDPNGLYPRSNPIDLLGQGQTPSPIYWQENTTSKYYVVIRDVTGRIIDTWDNFPNLGGSSGTTNVTVAYDIENLFVNGNFQLTGNTLFGALNNKSLLPKTPVPANSTTYLAPGGGATYPALTGGDSVVYLGGELQSSSGGILTPSLIPGWLFEKNGGVGLADTIQFVSTQLGIDLPDGPSANAPRYFEYTANGTAATTTLDLVYVMPDVRSLSNKTINISFDCNCDNSDQITDFILEQSFGNGGGESSAVLTTEPFTFPGGLNNWKRIVLPINVPAVTGKTIGANNNSALFFRWRIPSEINTVFRISNLQCQEYTGSPPPTNYLYNDFNSTVAQCFGNIAAGSLHQTGDVKYSISTIAAAGWLVINESGITLGSSASGAFYSGEAVRNLYRLIWNTYSQTNAPVSSGSRGVSADADFNANFNIELPPWLGETSAGLPRVFAPVNNASVLANINLFPGSPTHTIASNEMPSHIHTIGASLFPPGVKVGTNTTTYQGGVGSPLTPNTAISLTQTDATGGSTPINIVQPTAFIYMHIKL